MPKNINVRVAMKRDTAANWTINNPVLLRGEIIIVDTAEGDVRFKIGDGVKTFNQLPFQDEKIYAEFEKYLKLEGGALTGPLTLAEHPTEAYHATTKEYVDTIAESLAPVQSNWDTNDPSDPSYIEGRPFYEVSDYSVDQEIASETPAQLSGDNTFIITTENPVIFNVDAQCDIALYKQEADEYILIFSSNFIPDNEFGYYQDDFSLTAEENTITLTLNSDWYGTYEEGNYIIDIISFYDNSYIAKIDKKFLPDDAFNSPNWDINDPNEPGYIEGRTHYIETTTSSEIYFSDMNFTEAGANAHGVTVYTASGSNEEFLNLGLVDGTYIVVYWGEGGWGTNFYENENGQLYTGNESFLPNSEGYDSGYPFYIILDGANYTIYTNGENIVSEAYFQTEESYIEKLPEYFLPDEVVRTWDVATSEKNGAMSSEDKIKLDAIEAYVEDEVLYIKTLV